MKIDELLEGRDQDLADWQASRSLCKSSKPDSSLGASALSSCVSQGFRSRKNKKTVRIGKKRVSLAGKKVKGAKYGGPLPDYNP